MEERNCALIAYLLRRTWLHRSPGWYNYVVTSPRNGGYTTALEHELVDLCLTVP